MRADRTETDIDALLKNTISANKSGISGQYGLVESHLEALLEVSPCS